MHRPLFQVAHVAFYVSRLPSRRRVDAYANFMVQMHIEGQEDANKEICLRQGHAFMAEELAQITRRAVARLIELPDPVTGKTPTDKQLETRTRSRLTAVQWFFLHDAESMFADGLAAANALVRRLVSERDPGMASMDNVQSAMHSAGWLGPAILLLLGDVSMPGSVRSPFPLSSFTWAGV